MDAKRNLMHAAGLVVWGLMGLVFTAKALFGAGPLLAGITAAGTWWLWFGGYAALTTVLMRSFAHAMAPLLVHAGMYITLAALPQRMPLSLFRLGLDLLHRAHA